MGSDSDFLVIPDLIRDPCFPREMVAVLQNACRYALYW
jgi:hypothetical protein